MSVGVGLGKPVRTRERARVKKIFENFSFLKVAWSEEVREECLEWDDRIGQRRKCLLWSGA